MGIIKNCTCGTILRVGSSRNCIMNIKVAFFSKPDSFNLGSLHFRPLRQFIFILDHEIKSCRGGEIKASSEAECPDKAMTFSAIKSYYHSCILKLF